MLGLKPSDVIPTLRRLAVWWGVCVCTGTHMYTQEYMHMGAALWQAVGAGPALQHGPCLGATHAAPSSENRNEETQPLSLADGMILFIGLHFPRSRVNFEI